MPQELTVEGGGRVLIFDELDSTNEEARRIGEAGAPADLSDSPLWIIAKRQTAGRGRRGRAWQTGSANFAGTLLLRPAGDAAKVAQLSFVAALSVGDALSTLGQPDAQLKWPNDILINDQKVSGILLESASAQNGAVDWLAVGIGINLVEAPADLPYPATSLKAEGLDPAPALDTVIHALVGAWSSWFNRWQNDGFVPIREAWLTRAARLGETISARLGSEEMTGRFIDLDESGNLVIETSRGRRAISSGEVFFLGT